MSGNGFHFGDNNQMSNSAVGNGASTTNLGSFATGGQRSPSKDEFDTDTSGVAAGSWDLGVVTILPVETRAVVESFGLTQKRRIDDLFFNTGEVETESGTVNVVAARTHSPGQRSVMPALDHLRRHFAPRQWLLVGIAGGIHPRLARIGDVVVSTRVVYYDSRKIKAGDEVQHRGEERESPARMVHAVNAYFTDHSDPAPVRGQVDGHRKRTFEATHGPIGSGEAVIAAHDTEVRGYLEQYNDKVLAVDMESGGLSQYWQENSVGDDHNPGWVVVRGISDNADQAKNDDSHELAAFNAAHVARELLPYLC